MGETCSSAGSVKSDGGSSVDSPMGTTAEVTVPRDILTSMNEYISGVDNLVESYSLWERASGRINNGEKSESFYPLLTLLKFAVFCHASVTKLLFCYCT